MTSKANYLSRNDLKENIAVARGLQPATCVIKNVTYLDVFSGAFQRGDVAIHGGMIVGIDESYDAATSVDGDGLYLVPGFIDAHVHIESSLMTPARFQQAILPCGTTSVIWDPHEIANVKGTAGIEWALTASEQLALDVFFMIPSCVPSTDRHLGLESGGADLGSDDLRPFVTRDRVLGLAEMMNYPGLLAGDEDIMTKLQDFQNLRRDGHCPGLAGKDLNAYGVAGIHSCHESTTLAEAAEKLRKGIHILVREGSCAKDADVLLPLIQPYSSATVGLCSDDRNPADIAHEGHINAIIDKGLRLGLEPEALFRSASYAPARIYGLDDRGAIAPGYQADFVLVRQNKKGDWREGMTVHSVYKNGNEVHAAELKKIAESNPAPFPGQNMFMPVPSPKDFQVRVAAKSVTAKVRVIGVIPGQLLTTERHETLAINHGFASMDTTRDILKIAVWERHRNTGSRSVAFVAGFGLKRGAIATSINHDSHNAIAVGASDEAMSEAMGHLRSIDGGIVVVDGQGGVLSLRLPIAGLMTEEDPANVAQSLLALKAMTKSLGCVLDEPFLQLSFLALPVIPALKITDKGLVNVAQSRLVAVDVNP